MQENPYDTLRKRLELAFSAYGDMLFRIALNMLGQVHDAEDAVQEAYLRYMKYEPTFEDAEHEKRWLVRVTVNVCKNMQKRRARRSYTDIESLSNLLEYRDEERLGILEAIMSLPEKYRIVMDLYYIEGFDSARLAQIIGISPAAVRKRLQHGRKLLGIELGEK